MAEEVRMLRNGEKLPDRPENEKKLAGDFDGTAFMAKIAERVGYVPAPGLPTDDEVDAMLASIRAEKAEKAKRAESVR